MRALAVWLLLVSTGLAQGLTSLAPSEIRKQLHEPIELLADFDIPEGWSAVFSWEASPPASIIQINSGRTAHVWAPAGTYQIKATAFKVNFQTQELGTETRISLLVVEAGNGPTPVPPGPEPGPEPVPPVPQIPDDQYGNLGQAVATWTASASTDLRRLAPLLADNYLLIAGRLEGSQEPLIPGIDEATTELRTLNRNSLAGNLGPREFRAIQEELEGLAAVLTGRWSPEYDKADLITILRIVAKGLRP